MNCVEYGTAGSGWGVYKKGRQATIAEIKQGDVLLCDSKQFGARNVVRVLRLDQTGMRRPLFTGFFVCPWHKDELRVPDDREFTVWDFELEGQYFFA